MKKLVSIALGLVLVSSFALAQTTILANANQFTFTASNDHDKPGFGGYRVKLAKKATPATYVKVVDLGKPAHSGGTTFKVTVRKDALAEDLEPNVEYVADVFAYGTYGESIGKARVAKILVFGAPEAPTGADAQNVR